MRAILIAVSAVTYALFLGACSTAPTEGQAPSGVEQGQPSSPSSTPTPVETPSTAPVDLTKEPATNPLKDPNNILSKRAIYFEFDRFEIQDQYRPIVEAHAKYLRDHPEAKVLVQGNADERGSREYNVGLGQRRSDSVKKALTLLGAKDSQIESVSLGEEKPSCMEHSEDCWAKNRRADVLYNGEY